MANIQVQALNDYCKGTMNEALGIIFTEITPEYVKATMPVNENTMQPMGILNGGASMALVETVASAAANLLIDRDKQVGFGLEINGNHCRPANRGTIVTATATPLHIGKTTQIWQVNICDEAGKLVNTSRMTIAIRDKV